jgi:hypothetical protein
MAKAMAKFYFYFPCSLFFLDNGPQHRLWNSGCAIDWYLESSCHDAEYLWYCETGYLCHCDAGIFVHHCAILFMVWSNHIVIGSLLALDQYNYDAKRGRLLRYHLHPIRCRPVIILEFHV